MPHGTRKSSVFYAGQSILSGTKTRPAVHDSDLSRGRKVASEYEVKTTLADKKTHPTIHDSSSLSKETKLLSDQAAIEACGLPLIAREQMDIVNEVLGCAVSIRGINPNSLFDVPCAPKPRAEKSKSATFGLQAGTIPEDYAYLGKEGGEVKSDHKKEYMQLTVPLDRIIAGLNSGHYQLVDAKDGRIWFKALDAKTEKEKNITYTLNLQSPVASESLVIDTAKIHSQKFKKDEIAQPSWWDEKALGNFNAVLTKRYAAEYTRSSSDAEVRPLRVQALPVGKNGELVPITGDADMLIIGSSLNAKIEALIQKIIPNADKILDASEFKDGRELASVLKFNTLLEKLKEEPVSTERDKLIHVIERANNILKEGGRELRLSLEGLLGSQGVGTKREFLWQTLANLLIHQVAPHIHFLIQHGAEVHNPGKLSDLNGKVLHIWREEGKSKAVMTTSERELVEFLSKTPGYLKNCFMPVHPKWVEEKGKLWGAVVAKQIECGQVAHMDEKLLKNVDQYLFDLSDKLSVSRSAVNYQHAQSERFDQLKKEHLVLASCSSCNDAMKHIREMRETMSDLMSTKKLEMPMSIMRRPGV